MRTAQNVSVTGMPPRNRRRFTPLALMPVGTFGVWYDPSDLSTLFQDAAGTVPVTTAGQPVGMIRDKGLLGLHAVQTVANARPTYGTTGTGVPCLIFDGVDDCMTTAPLPVATAQELTVFAGINKLSDAQIGTLVSIGGAASLAGNVQVYAPRQSISYGVRGFTAASGLVELISAGFPAPDASVLTAHLAPQATAGNQIVARRNGVEMLRGGSGLAPTFNAAPLTLGRRQTDLPFRGEVYAMALTAIRRTQVRTGSMERWIGRKMGITL